MSSSSLEIGSSPTLSRIGLADGLLGKVLDKVPLPGRVLTKLISSVPPLRERHI